MYKQLYYDALVKSYHTFVQYKHPLPSIKTCKLLKTGTHLCEGCAFSHKGRCLPTKPTSGYIKALKAFLKDYPEFLI